MTGTDAAEELPHELGEFAIEGELGRGGSGVVYAARWQGQPMALKVLRPDEAATPKERDRFLGEARLLAKVQHSGVVRVFTSGLLPDGRPYLGMERLTGAALAERLLMGRLPVGQALALFEQIATAVSALHAAGIDHRDIKPENIMLVDGGHRAVLLDFGIARGVDDAASTTTQMGLQRGTPAYMAPERFFGARATIGSDVYETAVVLFVMLTGHLPWRDPRSPHDRLEPRTPSSLGVDLPAGLEREIMRALAPKPEGRPASIAELASAVREHAWEGDTVRAHSPATHPGAASVSVTTTRVRKPLVIGGVVLAVGGVLAAVLVVMLGGRGTAAVAGSSAPADAAPVLLVVEAVVDAGADAGADVDAAAAAATGPDGARGRRVRGSGSGSGSAAIGSGTGAGTGTGAAGAGAYDPDMPTCHKLFGLYCTDDFKATEGAMAGALCTGMQKVMVDFHKLPADARRDQEKYCVDNYRTMSGAVAERLRLWKAGLGPGQRGVPPVADADAGAP